MTRATAVPRLKQWRGKVLQQAATARPQHIRSNAAVLSSLLTENQSPSSPRLWTQKKNQFDFLSSVLPTQELTSILLPLISI
jgi:hypothetical protein